MIKLTFARIDGDHRRITITQGDRLIMTSVIPNRWHDFRWCSYPKGSNR